MPGRNVYETDALRLFDAVARTGSFTAAADELGYTQSAVSRRIASLEQRAGGPLFERLPRGARLTPAGRLLHRHAREVLDRLAHAHAELAALHAGTAGPLRVGAFATAAAALLPATLREFRAACPGVRVGIAEGLSRELMTRLHDGDLDIAVVSDYPLGLEPPDGTRLRPILEDELLVALPADHPLAGRGSVDLAELRDANWIEGAPPARETLLVTSCRAAGFTPRVGVRIGEWTGKLGFVAAGLGVTLVPRIMAPAVRPDVALCSLGASAPRRTVFAALPAAAPLPAARTLLRLLAETARAYGGPPRTAATGT